MKQGTPLASAFRVFAPQQDEALRPARVVRQYAVADEEVEVFTDGSCRHGGTADARAGSGLWFGRGDPRNSGERVPYIDQSNQIAEIYAVAMAHRATPPFAPLHIVSDSKYVVDGLTKHLAMWEKKGWIGVANAGAFMDAAALLRTRSAPTTFRWVKGHTGVEGNEGADALANQGANLDRQFLPTHKIPPREFLMSGALLKEASQRILYRGIMARQPQQERRATGKNLRLIEDAIKAWGQRAPASGALWEKLRRDPIAKKTRDFLWKCIHGAYRVGHYWDKIPGYEGRARCTTCGVVETMEHILQDCRATETDLVWRMVRTTLDHVGIKLGEKPSFGLYLGAAALEVTNGEGSRRPGATRLARILIPEAAYLVWRLRCRRVIEWCGQSNRSHSERAICNEWLALLAKRLRVEQMAASAPYAKASKVSAHKVSETWRGIADADPSQAEEWAGSPGVLVGILPCLTRALIGAQAGGSPTLGS
ncbi:ribonuclease H-like protein [Trametes coccinea BRFM310]|uniref:ribonuclease H n=1 Tax=Trametes coccinea (strain BRFM310) TaxID=1353009 RepID=A0A1Y2IAL4_TRAC3|nr:ribonuclease H-like protein [Trametes coccinea BRFM310]